MTDLVSADPRSLYNTSPSSDTSCSTTLSMADRLETMYTVSASPPLDSAVPPPKKRKVNFSLTLDIKQETEVRKQRKYLNNFFLFFLKI